MQTELLSQLRQTLETLLKRIETGEDIVEQLEHINAAHQKLTQTETPRTLLHYLERKSYAKAHKFLVTALRE